MLPKIFFYLFLAADALFVLTVISFWVTNKSEKLKYLFFSLYVVTALSATGYLIHYTVDKNVTSVTGGPVHWHADFEVYACGEKIELIDPKGWSNKVGTSLFHEHDDKRIHVEGVVKDMQDVTLGEFFRVTGGELTDQSLTVVTNDPSGMTKTYEQCNGVEGSLQLFVLKTESGKIIQTKSESPTSYVLSPQAAVPPGDCLIIEFDVNKSQTERLCQSYGAAVERGELTK